MDEVFNKIKERAIKAKDEAAKITKHMMGKTNDVISKTKLSFAISEAESKIKDMYVTIGKKMYDLYTQNGEGDEELLECYQKIDTLNSEIAELKEKISELCDVVVCECGEHNKKEAVYCAKCGKKLADNDEVKNVDYMEV